MRRIASANKTLVRTANYVALRLRRTASTLAQIKLNHIKRTREALYMLGSIRFFLACFVLISHFPNNGMKLNLGVVSVICFYFISGFLMRKSFTRFQVNSKTPATDFYIDRVIKLFPQYIVIVLATFACISYFGKS